MTQEQKPAAPGDLTPDQANAIGGGDCTAQQIVQLTNELKQAYDNLVDFTSYVIERVAGP